MLGVVEDLDQVTMLVPLCLPAKLGDTQELEEFIAILDQALEGRWPLLKEETAPLTQDSAPFPC